MNLHIINAVSIIPDSTDNKVVVSKQDIYINEGIIGDRIETSEYKQLDLKNSIIIPGLVNSHHHIYSYPAKALSFNGDFSTFENILENLWWKLDKTLTEEAIHFSAEQTVRECVENGVTTVFDHHSSPSYIEGSLDLISSVFRKYSLNGAICHEITDRNGRDCMEKTLNENVIFARSNSMSDVKGMLGLHALFTLSDESLKEIADKSDNIPVHIHVAEGNIDVENCRLKHNKTIPQRLDEFGLIREKSLFVHGNYLSQEDLKLLGQGKNIFYSQCVDSNMNNQEEILNLIFADTGGLTYTAGTDGMTSNILKSIKNSILLNKYSSILNTEKYAIPERVFNNLFLNQYKLKEAYGFDLGLNKGDKADFAVVNYSMSELINEENFFSHFLFGITESRVKHVFKNNEFLMKDYILQIDDTENCNISRVFKDMRERLLTI